MGVRRVAEHTRRPLAAVLLSGGMDSTVLLAHYAAAGYRLLAVSVDYAQRHGERELAAAGAVAAYYGAERLPVDMRAVGALLCGSALTDPTVQVPSGHYEAPSMRATVVANRNNLLAHVLVSVVMPLGADVAALGVHAGDHAIYPDCRPPWVDALGESVRVGNEGYGPPRVEAPFVHLHKWQIAALGAALGAPLHLTYSCYQGQQEHCGTCGTCVERREAFADAGLPDPTEYQIDGHEGDPPQGAAEPALSTGAVSGAAAGKAAR